MFRGDGGGGGGAPAWERQLESAMQDENDDEDSLSKVNGRPQETHAKR